MEDERRELERNVLDSGRDVVHGLRGGRGELPRVRLLPSQRTPVNESRGGD